MNTFLRTLYVFVAATLLTLGVVTTLNRSTAHNTDTTQHSVYISQAQYETGQPAWNAKHGDLLVIIMARTSVSDTAWVALCSDDMAGEPTVSPQGVAQCESTDF